MAFPASTRSSANPSSFHSTLANLGSVLGGAFLIRFSSFAIAAGAARLYGASALGMYATALAYATVAVTISDNGMQISAATEIHRRGDDLDQVVGHLYNTKTALLLPALIILFAISPGGDLASAGGIVFAWVTLRTVLQSYGQLQFTILKYVDRMQAIGRIQAIHCGLIIAGLVTTFYLKWSFPALLACLTGAQALELTLSSALLWRFGIRLRWFQWEESWQIARRSFSAGITQTLFNGIIRSDIIVLSSLVSVVAVGEFAAAHTLMVPVYSAAWLFGTVLLPDLVRLAPDKAALSAYVKQWSRILLVVTLPLCVLCFLLIPFVVPGIFGKAFVRSSLYASIMVLAIPFIVLNVLQLLRVVALDLQSIYLRVYLYTASFAVAGSVILGLAFGPIGVAVTLVLRELLMFGLFRRLAPLPVAGPEAPVSVEMGVPR